MLVELKEFSYIRSKTQILKNISLSVKSGDFLGIVGPNGAGKSTLLKAVGGDIKPSEGEVRSYLHANAVNNSAYKTNFRPADKIGFLLQQQNFRPEVPFTAEDIVRFGKMQFSLKPNRFNQPDRISVDKALQAMQIEHLRNRLYRNLSGGERQKVQLARIYAQQAELILLDEPAAGLDLDWQERLTKLVGDIHSVYEKTVVMVTHEIDHLPDCCNKILLMKEGTPLASGSPKDILTSELLSKLYECPMEVVKRGNRFHAFSTGLT